MESPWGLRRDVGKEIPYTNYLTAHSVCHVVIFKRYFSLGVQQTTAYLNIFQKYRVHDELCV